MSINFRKFAFIMIENSLYDRKSLRAIYGPKADFKEIAKNCVAFANAQGGIIDFGIEDELVVKTGATTSLRYNLATKSV